MAYLYGDATPFPLDENFIETLTALTEACVALFATENDGSNRRHRIAEAQTTAEAEISHVERLSIAVQTALQPFLELGKATPAGRAAADVATVLASTIKRTKDESTAKRDQLVHSSKAVDVAELVRKACGPFFVRHQLPDTKWGAVWSYDPSAEKANLDVFGYAPGDIRLRFRGGVQSDSPWAEPIRVSEIADELDITVAKEPGLLGKGKTKTEHLHKTFITGVTYRPGNYQLTLRTHAKKASAGFRLVIKDGNRGVPYVQRLGADDSEGAVEQLAAQSAINAKALWDGVQRLLTKLPGMRQSLASVRIGAKAATECDQPQRLAEMCLRTIAPIVVEMRKRSRVPGELALKRELGGGRREELFVPRVAIAEKFAGLPDNQRRVFEAMGLSSEPTQQTIKAAPAAASTPAEPSSERAKPKPSSAPPPVPTSVAVDASYHASTLADADVPDDDEGTREIIIDTNGDD